MPETKRHTTVSPYARKPHEKIDMMIKLMEWDYLTEDETEIIISLEEFYNSRQYLTEKQYDLFKDLFERAADRA